MKFLSIVVVFVFFIAGCYGLPAYIGGPIAIVFTVLVFPRLFTESLK